MPFVHATYASLGIGWTTMSRVISDCRRQWASGLTDEETLNADIRRFLSIGHSRLHLLWMLGFVIDRYPELHRAINLHFSRDDCEIASDHFLTYLETVPDDKANPE